MTYEQISAKLLQVSELINDKNRDRVASAILMMGPSNLLHQPDVKQSDYAGIFKVLDWIEPWLDPKFNK